MTGNAISLFYYIFCFCQDHDSKIDIALRAECFPFETIEELKKEYLAMAKNAIEE